jgi:TPR repeat protein
VARSSRFHEAIDLYNKGEANAALEMIEACAQEDDPVACYMAALWWRDRNCGDTSLERSAYWLDRLSQLANQGNPEAQWEIGQQYRFGDLVPVDFAAANRWLERAAEGGNGEAQHHLAWYLETGQYGYQIDTAAATDWYRRALEAGNPETLYLFACKAFRNGQPTDEARALLKRAADSGLRVAEELLHRHSH